MYLSPGPQKGPDLEGGKDGGELQQGLELVDLMVTHRKGPVSENNLAHVDMINGTGEDRVDHNYVSPDEAGEVPGGDVV